MKNFRILQFALALSVIPIQGCYIGNLHTIEGDGNVVTRERDIGSFEQLSVAAGIDVYITQGETESLELEADENLHEVIMTEVSGGKLRIWTDYNIRRAKAKEVHLVYRELRSLKISSAGDVYGTGPMEAGDIDISLSSAGDLALELNADHIDLHISSSGDAKLSGTANVLNASLSSAGDLDAFDLEVKKCKVRVSSAGNARVNASEELDMASSSAGDIYYKGDARITHMSTSSAGSISKR